MSTLKKYSYCAMRPDAPTREIPSHYFSPRLPGTSQEYSRCATLMSVGGKTLQMASGEGVFSKDKLDAGSRLLLKTILQDDSLRAAKRICDLGCGWGAVGCFLAIHCPAARVSMCDINGRAPHLATFNARQNNLKNAWSWRGDGLGAARDEYFDLIACNPPIRAGNATIAEMFSGAHRCLAANGVLIVVIRTAQGAKSWQKRLEDLFGNCQTAAIESGYRILKCVK